MVKSESGGSAYEGETEYASTEVPPNIAPGEIVLGTMTGIDADGSPLVDYINNPTTNSLAAISTVSVTRQYIGRQVALLFTEGDFRKPVIVGFIHSPLYAMLENFGEQEEEAQAGAEQPLEESYATAGHEEQADLGVAHVDGEKVVIEGKKEVVLKCGEASITLTRAGKILIRGKYLVNRSTGVNRILGTSVQVN